MFDIGFSELIVIAIVALIVIGPERLPAVARTVGTLLGRLRRYTDDVKAEVHRELQLDDIRKMQRDLAEKANALEARVTREIDDIAAPVVADPVSGETSVELPSPAEENRILPTR